MLSERESTENSSVDEELDGGVTATATPEDDPEWAALLGYLMTARGFDFHGYKSASLARRIRKQMSTLGLEGFAAYQDYLEVHPDEFATLFNVILINVTGFFRDPPAWQAVRTIALPEILRERSPDEPIRAWSAGCATGEEAYTIAMVLAEELGPEEFRSRVKIYATDVDEDALTSARQAAFTDRQLEGLPPELLSKYFEQLDGVHVFRKDLRRQLIFGRHDLINDAPISRIDLLACRNTLMYLNAETQARVLTRFHFGLNDGGFLLLGRAETLMARDHHFHPVDLKRRLSRKATRGSTRNRLGARQAAPELGVGASQDGRIWAQALEVSPVAQMVVDAAGQLILINDRARALFGIRTGEAGLLRDLEGSYRPVELRSLVEKAETERRTVSVKEVEWQVPIGEARWLDLHVAPLMGGSGAPGGALISFVDITGHRRLHQELEQSQQELETAYEELQSTNEELETTNEELQSTNEELETMNEELQSTNVEFQRMNEELRQREDELSSANSFFESVLAGLEGGVAVVDRDLRVLAWNGNAEELWGLRRDEVNGQHLLNLDFGLPVERLRPVLRSCLTDGGERNLLTLSAVNRRGKAIRCDITCTPLRGSADEVRGAILLMQASGDGGS